MNAVVGWGLAGLALVVGWFGWGWQGIVLAITVIVFWLLLQFSRTLRVLRGAAQSPVGHVASAVMLNAKLQAGMRLPQIIGMTGSLGRKLREEPETWGWSDAGGDAVELEFERGRCVRWRLVRAANGSADSVGA